MTKQKRHIRTSKKGTKFKAGKRKSVKQGLGKRLTNLTKLNQALADEAGRMNRIDMNFVEQNKLVNIKRNVAKNNETIDEIREFFKRNKK
jgi:hypothetical protein